VAAQPTPFPRLLEPFAVGRLKLTNRLVVLPHGTSMVRDGNITEEDIAYFEARARSHPAMIIMGAIIVHPSSSLRGHHLVEAYHTQGFEMLQRRSDAIHAHGVKVIGQLVHLGREMIGGELNYAPSAPSSIRSPRDPFAPHELSQREIATLVQAFAESAANLQMTGHDGAEIHGAHGYLVAQFLSPATNQRTDGYGGTPEKRMRFLLEVLEAMRTRCGDDFVLGLRLSADEEIADGMGIQDTARVTTELARLACVDYLSITLGTRGSYVKDVSTPVATAARAAHIIRDASGLPIIVGQRITTPEVAERLLANGDADLIGVARAMIADPEWMTKAAQGQAARIRPCIGLNQDCRAFSPHLHCATNPATGRELLPEFGASRPTTNPRRVAVIGGGPGGLEAARVAAMRGHKVTVFEASDGLGGQFLYASSVPHRKELRGFIDYLRGELRHYQVGIEMRTRIDDPSQVKGDFEVAILATGAVAKSLPAEFAADRVMTWFDVLEKGAPAPQDNNRAVLVDDGSAFWWTYGVAEALVEAGWQLLIATPSAAIAQHIPAESANALLARLGRAGTEYRVLTTLYEVAGDGAHLINVTSGEEFVVDCGLTVVQTGRTPVTNLAEPFENSGMEFHMIGDCVTPRRMSHAVFEAHRLAGTL
jgi:2,4-dienoyl-CoA reductase (NADPH2)